MMMIGRRGSILCMCFVGGVDTSSFKKKQPFINLLGVAIAATTPVVRSCCFIAIRSVIRATACYLLRARGVGTFLSSPVSSYLWKVDSTQK